MFYVNVKYDLCVEVYATCKGLLINYSAGGM